MQECLPLQRAIGRSKSDFKKIMAVGSSNEEVGMSKSDSEIVMASRSFDEEVVGWWPESRVSSSL